jgi:hypothetical protein
MKMGFWKENLCQIQIITERNNTQKNVLQQRIKTIGQLVTKPKGLGIFRGRQIFKFGLLIKKR